MAVTGPSPVTRDTRCGSNAPWSRATQLRISSELVTNVIPEGTVQPCVQRRKVLALLQQDGETQT